MKEREKQDNDAIEALRQNVRSGIEQANRGDMEDVDDGIMERIRAGGRLILAAERATGP